MKSNGISRKGFSLLELTLSIFVSTIVFLACSQFFNYQITIFRKQEIAVKKYMAIQAVVEHMLKNIRSSAWVKVVNGSHIELYSHSDAKVREYEFKEGSIFYNQGDGKFVDIAGLTKEKLGVFIDAEELFKGVGEKRPVNRFKILKIAFNEKRAQTESGAKPYSIGINTYAVCNEDWDALYVDNTKRSALSNGTKLSPFNDLKDALGISTEDGSTPFFWGQSIMAQHGEYDISGTNDVFCRYLDFAEDTKVNIRQGTVLNMGKGAVLSVRGDIMTEASKAGDILIKGSNPMPEGWWKEYYLVSPKTTRYFETWVGIDINTRKNLVTIKGLELRDAIYGMHINNINTSLAARGLILSDVFFHDNHMSLIAEDINSMLIQNSFFEDNAVHVDTILEDSFEQCYTGYKGNIFISAPDPEHVYYIGGERSFSSVAGTMNCELSGNSVSNASFSIYDASNCTANIYIHDNSWKGGNIGLNGNKPAVVNISNNIFNFLDAGYESLQSSNFLSFSNNEGNITISNNEFRNMPLSQVPLKNFRLVYIDGNRQSFYITNNIFSNLEGISLPVRIDSCSSADINNNLFYGCNNGVYIGNTQNCPISIDNNTFAVTTPLLFFSTVPSGVRIKNSIFWSDGTCAIPETTLSKISYCDIKGISGAYGVKDFSPLSFPGTTNIHDDPLYTDPQSGNYAPGSLMCKTKSDVNSEIGAYGGSGASKGLGKI